MRHRLRRVGSRLRAWATNALDTGGLAALVATAVHAVVARLTAGRRNPDLWVFGAREGEAFADNAKYLFLHVASERPDVRPVWVTRNDDVVAALRARGFEAHRADSLRGLRLQLRAGVAVLTHDLDDVDPRAVGGATTVMLWHGIPLKTVAWDAELADAPLPTRLATRYILGQYDRVTLPGRGTLDALASGLRLGADRFLVTGYPRTDALVGEIPNADVGADDAVRERIRRLADDGRVVVYLPTFRDAPADRASSRLTPDRLDRLDSLLASHDARLVVKLHPKERFDVDLARYSRIVALPSDVDVYPLLSAVDVLLTDYSSVFLDYLLLDRPVVFYPYDLDRYRDERGLYYDYESVTPGARAETFEELLAALERTLEGPDEFGSARATVRDRFFDVPAGECAATTGDAIRGLTADDAGP